jgi:hypothetical protein
LLPLQEEWQKEARSGGDWVEEIVNMVFVATVGSGAVNEDGLANCTQMEQHNTIRSEGHGVHDLMWTKYLPRYKDSDDIINIYLD